MKIIESTNDPRSEYYDLMRRESVPADELMGRRMEIGVVAVLGQLRAKRNWHRIMREWVYADAAARPSSASRSGSTSREEAWCEYPDWRATPDRRTTMSRIRRGWALTKKSWGLLSAHPELIRFPLYGAVATVLLAIVTIGPGLYLFEQDVLAGRDPGAGDRRLRAQRRRLLLQRRPRRRRRHDLPRPGQRHRRRRPRRRPQPLQPDLRLGGAEHRDQPGDGPAREPGRDRRPDRRPRGRHGLGAGHLPRRAGDRARGHRRDRHPEALGLDLPRALGTADHRATSRSAARSPCSASCPRRS